MAASPPQKGQCFRSSILHRLQCRFRLLAGQEYGLAKLIKPSNNVINGHKCVRRNYRLTVRWVKNPIYRIAPLARQNQDAPVLVGLGQLAQAGMVSDEALKKLQEQIAAKQATLEDSLAEQQSAKETLLTLLAALNSREALSRCQEIHLEDGSYITLRFDGRFDVLLSWDADFGYKLDCLLAVVDTKLEENEKGTIDLTRKEVRFVPG